MADPTLTPNLIEKVLDPSNLVAVVTVGLMYMLWQFTNKRFDLERQEQEDIIGRLDDYHDELLSAVDHPSHYHAQSGVEVIDAVEAWGLGFCLGNVIKYVARAGHKGDAREDLQKALWYLTRELSRYKD